VSFASHRVQRGCSSHVRQEADLEHMKQEVLVVDAVHSVEEQHHGGLVVWQKTGGHLRLKDLPICGYGRKKSDANVPKYCTLAQRIHT